MDVRGLDKRFLEKQEQQLTERIRQLQPDALDRFEEITGNRSIHSSHAMLGSNNNVYVDSVRTAFLDPNDFISRWIKGLTERVQIYAEQGRLNQKRYRRVSREYFLMFALKDDLLTEYLLLFLTRNFYRNFKERVRNKPEENLWSIWFGSGNLVWGLLISPEMRSDEWVNDKSEMRRASFNYWTVRHVMESGLIDPESDEPVKFSSPKQFSQFYQSILKRVSNSQYEKGIADRYLAYLRESSAPYEEPFLIPELRFAGKEKKHKYRLDYTVLNPYTMSRTGFEISPASTHMKVDRIIGVGKSEMNDALRADWAKEMKKRNEYFSNFGINTITFTDEDLSDLDHCFSIIRKYLAERRCDLPRAEVSLQNARAVFAEIAL
ncbi:topoisomerase II [Algiphilus aromaticivorans]|uniref:topoisomerase II n=1 Tax=Algiphilus aromaticivorans TaxID=382454 RepID=UPI0009FD1622|nr:topoisomerase II [Algiphilus aromaticivorans]